MANAAGGATGDCVSRAGIAGWAVPKVREDAGHVPGDEHRLLARRGAGHLDRGSGV